MTDSLLFTPLTLRQLTLRNRIVVSPMCQYSSVDGVVQPWHVMHLGGFAKSNPGLVIMEATAVSSEGRISPLCAGIWGDRHEEALTRMVANIRTFSDTPLGIQLAHAGRKASTRKLWADRRASGPLTPEQGAWPVVGPSASAYDEGWPAPEALDMAGLESIKAEWVAAARRADRSGFGLIEIHAAHGYLLSSFFSPLANHRGDQYGGDLEGRMRFPLEVVAAVRESWPEHKPLGIRINGSDWVDGGTDLDDAVVFAHRLKAAGVDYIVTSAGNVAPGMKLPPLEPGYMAHFARRVKAETGITTIAVGLVVDPNFAESLIRDGASDLVAVGRAFLDDPNWTYHAAQVLNAKHQHERAYNYIKPRGWPGYQIARGNQYATEI